MDLKNKVDALKNERSELLKNLDAKKDELSTDEFNEQMAKVDGLKNDIQRFEKLRTELSEQTMNVFETKEGKGAVKAFDFAKAIRNAAAGRAQDGAEAEIIAEAQTRFVNSGLQASGLALPMEVFNAHSAGAANNGQALISTEKGDFIESLKKYLVLEQLGVQYLTNLNGNIEFGASTVPASPSVKTETEASEEYTMTLANRTLSPVRGAVKGIFSKQLMHQTSYNVEEVLRSELLAGMLGRAEAHAIAEVLASAGTTVAMDTNGAALSFAKAIELLNAPSDTNSNGTNNAFITNSAVRAAAQQVALDSGSGRFLWEHTTPRQFLGEQAVVTNHMPSNLSKGSADSTLSAIAYGDFSAVTIGFWGGIDLIVDPYSLANSGQIQLVLNFFHDSVVRQPGNLAVIKDIVA